MAGALLALILLAAAGLAVALRPPHAGPMLWQDLQVVYLQAPGQTWTDARLDPATSAGEINALVLDSPQAVEQHARLFGLDVLIFDQASLPSIDPAWAEAQFNRGTAFAGVSLTPDELAGLLGRPYLASFGCPAPPYVSYAYDKTRKVPRLLYWWRQITSSRWPILRLARLSDLFGSVEIAGPNGAGCAEIRRSLPQALEDIRLNLKWEDRVRP